MKRRIERSRARCQSALTEKKSKSAEQDRKDEDRQEVKDTDTQ
ncbi:MAG: hypothetical protein ACREBG_07940 [Pyrinomonadaceae bacterium]